MKKLTIICLLLSLLPSLANAKILQGSAAIKNCQMNFDKISDKEKIDCLQTVMQINIMEANRRIADLELVTENLR